MVYTVTPVSAFVPAVANVNNSVYTVPAGKVFILRNLVVNSAGGAATASIRRHNTVTSNSVCFLKFTAGNETRFVETRVVYQAGWAIEVRSTVGADTAFTLSGYLFDA